MAQTDWLLFLACAFTASAFAGARVGRLVKRAAPVAFRRLALTVRLLMGLKLLAGGWHGHS